MKKGIGFHRGSLFLAAFLAVGVSGAFAQYRPGGKDAGGERGAGRGGARGSRGERAVTITSLEGVGRRTMVPSPEFEVRARTERKGYSSGEAREWAEIRTLFETRPEWLDVITVEYTVMAQTKNDGKIAYSLYRRSVDCIDVKRGPKHVVPVYLRPSAVERYGMPVAVHVVIMAKGAVLDTADETDPDVEGKLPPKWWESKVVLESERLTIRDGYLLLRSETPFAVVDVDEYEVMR